MEEQEFYKDVILLCKGFYDKGKYTTLKDALVRYYCNVFLMSIEDGFYEDKFLLDTVLFKSLYDLFTNHPDRLKTFYHSYFIKEEFTLNKNKDIDNSYYHQLYERIVCFFNNLQMRGGTLSSIDTSIYFEETENGRVLNFDIIG